MLYPRSMKAFVTPATVTIIVLRLSTLFSATPYPFQQECSHYDGSNGMALAKLLKTHSPARRCKLTCPQSESVVRQDSPNRHCTGRTCLSTSSFQWYCSGTLALDTEEAGSQRDEAIDAVSTRSREN
jgi:hypothetical protein